jgi:SAM-dependent methyltransferase
MKRFLPKRVWHGIRQLLSRRDTVSEGWERAARWYQGEEGENLGDNWSADEIGVDVPPGQVVSYLDQMVFTPFLGSCDVLLEIGPGGGRFTEILLPKCKRLVALDTSPTMLKLLRQRFSESATIKYVLGDGKGLSAVPEDSVDQVFSYDVFVHLQHWDIYNYLTEIRRVLRPGGKAVIHHANTFSELGWKLFLSHVPQSLNRHKLYGTFTVMTPDIMREFVRRAGLELVDTVTEVVRRDCISLIRLDQGQS